MPMLWHGGKARVLTIWDMRRARPRGSEVERRRAVARVEARGEIGAAGACVASRRRAEPAAPLARLVRLVGEAVHRLAGAGLHSPKAAVEPVQVQERLGARAQVLTDAAGEVAPVALVWPTSTTSRLPRVTPV